MLYSRLPLLVSCYRGNRDALETVVRHLTTHKRSVETRRALKFFLMVRYLRYPESSRQLLVLLYHVDERVLLFVDHGNVFLKSLVSSSPSIPCKVRPHTHSHTIHTLHTLTMQLDAELHHLVSAMCDAKQGQESVQRMTAAAMICRRIAYRHPSLFLRSPRRQFWEERVNPAVI